jgi:hypothetical protein
VGATPGASVEVAVRLRTPSGRRFSWEQEALADVDGVARVRVPYPTESATPIAADGPYRVRVGSVLYRARVSELDVRSGATVQAR